MSGMVRQMMENSELKDENFALKASNASLKTMNSELREEILSLRAEMLALKERREATLTSSSIATLASNAAEPAENISYVISIQSKQADDSPKPPPTSIASKPQVVLNEDDKKRIVQELFKAVGNGSLAELGGLLGTEEGRSCINETDRNGRTPLHVSAIYSKLEAVKLLVEMGGADVNHASHGYGTPLTLSILYGYDSLTEYLLSIGACREKAIANAHDSQRAVIQGFSDEFERVIQNRSELTTKREALKAKMMSSEEPETLPTCCKGITIAHMLQGHHDCPHVARASRLPTCCKGITIAGLRKMKALIQSECETGRFKEDQGYPDGTQCKGTMVYEELTTTDIVYRYVKDESVSDNLRLIDVPGIVASEHKALPTFFISHAWKGRFSVLLDKIFTYAEKHGLSEETAVWIDVFSVNQRAVCNEFSQAQNQADVAAFKDVVQTCTDGTLVICDFEKCVTSTRAWCLYEWDWTTYHHGREKLRFLGLSKKEAEEGKNNVDVQKADCFMAADKAMILDEIIKKHGSLDLFNQKLKNKWSDVQYGLMIQS